MGAALKSPPAARSSFTVSEERFHGTLGAAISKADGRIFRARIDMGGLSGPSNSWIFGRSLKIPLRNVRSEHRQAKTASHPHKERLDDRGKDDWNVLLSHVAEWENLDDDWDGEGGHAPSSEVIIGVREMIARLMATEVTVPRIYVVGDGEIGLRWEAAGMYASASFVDHGDLLLYMHEGDEVLHSEDVRWTADMDLDGFVRDVVRLT